MPEKFMTVHDVAEILQVHENTVRRYIDEGDLPAMRIGPNPRANFRISTSAFKRWCAEKSRIDDRLVEKK